MRNAEIKQRVINGSIWTIFSNISTNSVSFAVTVVLARLLTPEDFGIVAISAVFVGIVTLFQDLGMGSAIIQRQNIDDDYLSTSFSVSLLSGVAIAIVLAAVSPLVAYFYGKEVLKYILLFSTIGFILSPFTSIHTTLLTKGMEFRKLALVNILSQILSGIISVMLALLGYGVWSLVAGKIVSQPLLIPLIWRLVRWRPRLKIVKKCFNDLFGFGSNLLGFNIIHYISSNSDNLIIGKYLGPQALGYYSVAFNLMLKPLPLISWSIGKVLFPIFSTMQDDNERTRVLYLKVMRTISLITFPMMTGLIMVADEFILTAYGAQWGPAALPLKLLCVVGILQSVSTTGGVIYISHGRPDLNFKVGAFSSALAVLSFIIGIRWGLIGLITGYIIVSVPIFFIGQHFANRLIGLKMPDFLKSLAPASACSLVMATALSILKYINLTSFHMNISTALIAFVLTGVISYIASTIVFRVSEVSELFKIVKSKL